MTIPRTTRTKPPSAAAAPTAPGTTSSHSVLEFGGTQPGRDPGGVRHALQLHQERRRRAVPPDGWGPRRVEVEIAVSLAHALIMGPDQPIVPIVSQNARYSKGLQRLAKAAD